MPLLDSSEGWKINQKEVAAPTLFHARRNHHLPVALSRLIFGPAVLDLNSRRGFVVFATQPGKIRPHCAQIRTREITSCARIDFSTCQAQRAEFWGLQKSGNRLYQFRG